MSEPLIIEALRSVDRNVRELRVEIKEMRSELGARTSALEQWRWKWVGAFAVLSAIFSVALKLVFK